MAKKVNYDLLSDFGKRVEMRREEMGISRKALVKKMGGDDGLQEKTYRSWIHKSGTQINIDRLQQLCDILKIDADYLMGRIVERTHDNKEIHEYTGFSETVINYMHENYSDSCIPSLFSIIFGSEYPELFFDLVLQYISLPSEPTFNIYATQRDGGLTHITGVSSFSVDSQTIDRDIIRQAIMFRIQWIMEELARYADEKQLIAKENQYPLPPSLSTTRNNIDHFESVFHKRGDKWFYTDKSGNEHPALNND